MLGLVLLQELPAVATLMISQCNVLHMSHV